MSYGDARGADAVVSGLSRTARFEHGESIFPESHLLAYDFDNTCFWTIGTGGPDVDEAYSVAIGEIMGIVAQDDFHESGGLRNRAPVEVVADTLAQSPRTVINAYGYATELFHSIDDDPATPCDRYISRFITRGSFTPDEIAVRAITEMLVTRKKQMLLPLISSQWPLPVHGFAEHWQTLQVRQQSVEGWQGVHTAIISSGHTDIIQKVLAINGLPEPDVYVTADEMRHLQNPRPKPDPMAIEIARYAWMEAYDVVIDSASVADAKTRQTYTGDDPVKDGEMATKAGIQFYHQDGLDFTWSYIDSKISEMVEAT